jgi:hypothetical protein
MLRKAKGHMGRGERVGMHCNGRNVSLYLTCSLGQELCREGYGHLKG